MIGRVRARSFAAAAAVLTTMGCAHDLTRPEIPPQDCDLICRLVALFDSESPPATVALPVPRPVPAPAVTPVGRVAVTHPVRHRRKVRPRATPPRIVMPDAPVSLRPSAPAETSVSVPQSPPEPLPIPAPSPPPALATSRPDETIPGSVFIVPNQFEDWRLR